MKKDLQGFSNTDATKLKAVIGVYEAYLGVDGIKERMKKDLRGFANTDATKLKAVIGVYETYLGVEGIKERMKKDLWGFASTDAENLKAVIGVYEGYLGVDGIKERMKKNLLGFSNTDAETLAAVDKSLRRYLSPGSIQVFYEQNPPTYLAGLSDSYLETWLQILSANASATDWTEALTMRTHAFLSRLDEVADLDPLGPAALSQPQILAIVEESKSRYRAEQHLFATVSALYPDYQVLRNVRDPDFAFEASGRAMELDIFIPDLDLAFEYQGEQHYRPVAFFGGEPAFQKIKARDAEKRRFFADHDIQLVEVPYTWNGSLESLKTMIRGSDGQSQTARDPYVSVDDLIDATTGEGGGEAVTIPGVCDQIRHHVEVQVQMEGHIPAKPISDSERAPIGLCQVCRKCIVFESGRSKCKVACRWQHQALSLWKRRRVTFRI